jgi:predicted transcriptional regulator
MQQIQGIHYTHIPGNRGIFERLQDFLFVFNPFTNGVKKTVLMDLYHDTLLGCSELVDECLKRGLISEVKNDVYEITEKGSSCNILWYAIRDKFKLGEIRNEKRKVVSDSIISSILYVKPLPPNKKIDEILENASNYDKEPKFIVPARLKSRFQGHVSVLKRINNKNENSMSRLFCKLGMSYDELLSIRDGALKRGYIELCGTKRNKKYEDMRLIDFGVALLNTINWYLTEYDIVYFLPLKV